MQKVRNVKHLPVDLEALKNGLSSLLVSSQKAMFSDNLYVFCIVLFLKFCPNKSFVH